MTRCLVVGAAPASNQQLQHIISSISFDEIIAVDGGLDALRAIGVEPDVLCGDFDSVRERSSAVLSCAVFEFDRHKDFTDMDWALRYAFDQGHDQVVMAHGLSGRLDHSLGNLQLLAAHARAGEACWAVGDDTLVVCLAAPGPLNTISIDEGQWGTCSVFTQSDIASGVTEQGFAYSITNGSTTNGELWGISNELIGDPATITLEQGCLWVFLPLSALSAITYGQEKLRLL